MINTPIVIECAVLLVMSAVMIVMSFRRSVTAGLVPAFILNVLMNYWLSPALYTLPGRRIYAVDTIQTGLQQVLLGMAAVMAATLFVGPYLIERYKVGLYARDHVQNYESGALGRMVLLTAFIGFASYSVVSVAHFVTNLGSAITVINTLSNFILLAVGLWCYRQAKDGRSGMLLKLGVFCFFFVLLRLALDGFLSASGDFISVLGMFILCLRRLSWRQTVGFAIAAYLGMSVFATYMAGRDAIRQQVWGGSGYSARLQTIQKEFSNFSWFDPQSYTQTSSIDSRLNQTALIGSEVQYVDAGQAEFSGGQTVISFLLSPIPRFIWPDKPAATFGKALVTQYTGIVFSDQVSIATGPFFEGYTNFGSLGVFLFLFVWGLILYALDHTAKQALFAHDYYRFAWTFLTGFAFIDSGFASGLVVGTAVASAGVVWVVQRVYGVFRVGEWHTTGSQKIVRRISALVQSPSSKVHGRRRNTSIRRSTRSLATRRAAISALVPAMEATPLESGETAASSNEVGNRPPKFRSGPGSRGRGRSVPRSRG